MSNKTNKIEKKLIELHSQYKDFEEEGYSLQKKGQILVKKGVQGKKSCEYLLDTLSIFQENSESEPTLEIFLSDLDIKTEYELNENRQIGESLARSSIDLNFIVSNISSTALSTSTDSIIASNSIDLLKIYNPKIDIEEPYFLDIKELEDELDNELNEIDKSLSKRRKGAWDTLYSSSDDKLAQAAHTMRDIFSNIISLFASNEAVKNSDWWEEALNTKEGVSLRQRIRYLLFGPKENIVNDSEIRVIEINVNNCFNDDRFLKEIAHGSKKATQELVESKLLSMESTILQILKTRKKYS